MLLRLVDRWLGLRLTASVDITVLVTAVVSTVVAYSVIGAMTLSIMTLSITIKV